MDLQNKNNMLANMPYIIMYYSVHAAFSERTVCSKTCPCMESIIIILNN